MKKILKICSLLFTISTLSLALESYVSTTDEEVEARLKISAIVVEDVSVETQSVEFGSVVSGVERSNPKVDGKINITGEIGRGVTIAINHNGNRIDMADNSKQVELKNSKDEKLEGISYYPEFSSGIEKKKITGNKFILNGRTATMNVGGKLVVPKTINTGNYTTNMAIRVYYN